MREKKREPWRIVAAIAALVFIVYTWVDKDILSAYADLPREQLLPMIVTTAAVTLLKVAALTGGILLIRWLIGKCRKKSIKKAKDHTVFGFHYGLNMICSAPAASP